MSNAWCTFRMYTLTFELHDRRSAPVDRQSVLKIRVLKAEVFETMLYGCVKESTLLPV